jgi:predicted porin
MFATLSGGFGTVKIGRDLSGGSTAPLGAGKVDGTRAITGMDDNKADAVYFGNVRSTSLSYVTPNISGFNAYVGITPQNYGNLAAPSTASTTVLAGSTGIGAIATPTASSTKPDSSTGYGLTYANGPVSAALDISKFEETVSSLGNNATVTSMGASYDLGVAKVGAVYQTIKGDAKANTKSNILSVSVPLGAVTLGAAVGKRNATTTGAFSAVETKHTQVSASYALSKRTVVYFAHSDKNVAGATVNANDAKETGVGIAHTF